VAHLPYVFGYLRSARHYRAHDVSARSPVAQHLLSCRQRSAGSFSVEVIGAVASVGDVGQTTIDGISVPRDRSMVPISDWSGVNRPTFPHAKLGGTLAVSSRGMGILGYFIRHDDKVPNGLWVCKER
jgi:hypothetical protein